jgi:hypothetical protein
MRSFSKLQLLKSKFQEESKSFWQVLKEPNYRYLEIELPYYDYLRGNVLISDMQNVLEDCPGIDIGKLIALLYLQFLYQVRKGATTVNNKKQGLDLETLGYKLVSIKNDCIAPKLIEKVRKEEFKQVSPNTWAFEEHDEEIEQTKKNKPKYACPVIRMKAEDIYRGEILLNDLSQINEDIDFSVEELLAMLYIDFIKRIKQEGNDEKVLKSIVVAYDYFKPA